MRTGYDDRAWLEFIAELMAEPLTELPEDRIALMLRDTFDAVGVATSELVPGRPLTGEIYPLDGSIDGFRDQIIEWGVADAPRSHPVLRYYIVTGDLVPLEIADVLEDFLIRDGYGEGNAPARVSGMTEQVVMPFRAGARSGPSPLPGLPSSPGRTWRWPGGSGGC
ncbi:hypothetical protein [Pseudonocardia sp. T1-2H]|uniref:hypothetical protein n=1 Tax=Pseudonocardia sp. T1-2H TaxID=3128899 RepID=UPI003101519C